MSLVLLVLSATLLVGLARHSLSVATESCDRQSEMQRRWGTVSLCKAVLGRADEILARHVDTTSARLRNSDQLYPLVETVRLGDLDFRLRLDDESRKLNLNRVYASGGSDEVSEALRLLGHGGTAATLRPHQGGLRNLLVQPFESWGQVYALDELPGDEHPARWLPANTRYVTCWGNGRVHYSTSSDTVLEVVARNAAGPVTAARLLNLRSRNPSLGLDELLTRLTVRRTEENRLRSWLTDDSSCFSLWIVAEGMGPSWSELAVAEVTASASLQIHRFTW